ncbi:MltA domain-containing protein [Leptospira sp. 201903075]|uniref:MltA domain-containing protein n=1 Tax=Leptospira chreensis TaxID=2810035 RepID=UPI0019630058|nr:MltA domain-containing protein [Leptospira chreensis]MBM9589004.1 MltA domain-containing protein [Leptospira chreensis]
MGHSGKKESHLPFTGSFFSVRLSFVIGFLTIYPLFSQTSPPTENQIRNQNQNYAPDPKKSPFSQTVNLESALRESILYFQRKPEDTKIRYLEEEYTYKEILKSFVELQRIVHESADHQIQNEIKKRFKLIDLSPIDGPPTITGYYEVRIHGKSQPEGEYQYPALSPPIPKPDYTAVENPIHFPRERWKEKSIWEKYAKPIVFLRLTDLHLAQLEGSALVETETNELFRINYAADNGLNYMSPSVFLKGVCPSLKPYHLSNCIQAKPKEVTEAIFKNPRYIFFEKETVSKFKTNEDGLRPLGSGGIRLVPFRSVAMDKQIPLGFPVLLSFQSDHASLNNHLVFVHDRGNAITGEGRLDYYLGNGMGIDEVANHLLTKGNVTLLLPKKKNRELKRENKTK